MKKLIFILSILFISIACKKEKKIERNLWKNGGQWEIKTFEESTKTDPENSYDTSFIINNGGTIKFNKDGTGKFNFSNELTQYLENIFQQEQINADFTYHFSENTIYFIFDNVEGLAFDFDWEKDKVRFSFSETELIYSYDPETTTTEPVGTKAYSIQFICEKN